MIRRDIRYVLLHNCQISDRSLSVSNTIILWVLLTYDIKSIKEEKKQWKENGFNSVLKVLKYSPFN
jgi:hypothetical protein